MKTFIITEQDVERSSTLETSDIGKKAILVNGAIQFVEDCEDCDGKGSWEVHYDDSEIVAGEATCETCKGTGVQPEDIQPEDIDAGKDITDYSDSEGGEVIIR